MKTDILIKSFNRAFYLDRCIESIFKNVENYNDIIVLDDGTPEKYIQKLKNKYPKVIFKFSGNSQEKSEKINANLPISGYEIPSKLWVNSVINATDYVLVIEDDVWFTNKIDLAIISSEMKIYNVHLTKLGWQGNVKYLYNFEENKIGEYLISQFSSKLFLSNEKIMSLLIENKYKLFSIFCRLGITNNKTINEYYNYSSILMGLYKKEFWLYTWKDSKGVARELDLLKNSVSWVYKNKKNKNLISRIPSEVLKTTYISSAIGDYRHHEVVFNMLKFNKVLNEAWYKNEIDIMKNYPKDFSQEYLYSFIKIEETEDLNKENYNLWCVEFQNQFINAGAQVD